MQTKLLGKFFGQDNIDVDEVIHEIKEFVKENGINLFFEMINPENPRVINYVLDNFANSMNLYYISKTLLDSRNKLGSIPELITGLEEIKNSFVTKSSSFKRTPLFTLIKTFFSVRFNLLPTAVIILLFAW